MIEWALLVTSLQTRNATARMRVWRALKNIGAAVLRDGVYLLPDTEMTRRAFEEQAREVTGSSGVAHVLRLGEVQEQQALEFRALFDRSQDYGRLLESARKIKPMLTKRRLPVAERALKRLQREYALIRNTDYFPGPAAEQAALLLSEISTAVAEMAAPGEPLARHGRIQRLDRKKYRARIWATRSRPWVDRLSSAWLIKRFIDPKGRIVWLKDPARCPPTALGFDYDDAAFTHVGARVTFETLLASFDLEHDMALMRIGGLIHYLDVGGAPVPEAAGLESVLKGARDTITDDDRLLSEAMRIFDHLYKAYQEG